MKPTKLLCSGLVLLSIFLCTASFSIADPLDSWHLRYSSSKILNAVAYGNGTFVAVGDQGTILNSVDGITWGPKTSGTSMYLNGVTYGNSTFVAVGDHGTILISPDGGTWTPRTAYSGTTDNLSGIAYGNGIFVAVGDWKTVLTSPDGYTWIARTLGTFSLFPYAVWFGNGTFVSVGVSGDIFTSTDGLTWTERESPHSYSLFGVAYGNDTFVAVGHLGTVLTSPDGSTWTERNSGTSEEFYGVAFGNNTFVAVGYSIVYGDIIFTSPDGVVWTQRNSGTSRILYGVTYGEGTFVAVGGAILQSDPVSSDVFSDVPPDYWAYNYISAIYNAHITTGCSQNPLKYCPEDNVTRGQMAAFIIRAKYGETFSYTTTPYFTDVPSTHTFFKYVQKLKDDGITAVSGIYDVDSYVTRGQMAAFIIRSKYGENFSYTQNPYFSDVPATHGFFKYVQKLKDDHITAVSGTYGVDNIVTRAQMAAFLARAFLGMQ
jgi:photosystem II stability/assembly factor-like uncharacterized protein